MILMMMKMMMKMMMMMMMMYDILCEEISILGRNKTEYLSSSMPSPLLRDNSKDLRDFGTDAVELHMSETINLPVEALQISTTTEAGTDPISPEVEETQKSLDSVGVGTVDNEQTDEEDAKLRRSPSATSLISKKSSDSGQTERGNKSSVYSGEYSDSDRSRGEGSGHLSTKKGKRSKSFLQKQGDKLKAKFTLRSKKKSGM